MHIGNVQVPSFSDLVVYFFDIINRINVFSEA